VSIEKRLHLLHIPEVASWTSFGSSTLGVNLGKSHAFIYQLKRSVATLFTA
jgi:hypothetical protein